MNVLMTLTLLTCLPSAAPDAKPRGEMHLYLLIGQSNMAGRGKVEKEDTTPHPRVFKLNKKDEWAPAVDPLHFDKPIAGVGPGLTFGKRMAQANKHVSIGLIPCAAGGSPIDVWRKGGFWKQTNSKPYDETLRRVAIARKSGVLKGVIWHQGESDANAKNAPEHPKQLAGLVARLRGDLKAPDVPFIVGGMSDPFMARNEHAKKIDAALRDLPAKVKGTAYVSAEKLTLKSDRIHFDTASERELERRYAKAMIDALKRK